MSTQWLVFRLRTITIKLSCTSLKERKKNVIHKNTADEISLDNRRFLKNTPFFVSLLIKS